MLDNPFGNSDWSPCIAFRYGGNACGENLRIPPIKIYEYQEFGRMRMGKKSYEGVSYFNHLPYNVFTKGIVIDQNIRKNL